MNIDDFPQHVVIEGPIGVGKTTLAKKLAITLSAQSVLDNAKENPFLSKFYGDTKNYALQTQLFFLLARTQLLEDIKEDMLQTRYVSDFMLDKEQIFAQILLDNDDAALYQRLYKQLQVNVTPPDLVVYLQAPANVLYERIMRRGEPAERKMQQNYLQQITESYAQFFHNYSDAPVLIVNARSFNPLENEDDYQDLLEQMKTIKSGKYFFNPMSLSS